MVNVEINSNHTETQTLEEIVSGLRTRYHLPESALFDGFIIWRRKSNEVLIDHQSIDEIETPVYGADITMAKRFFSYSEALLLAKRMGPPTTIGATFDIKHRIYVVSDCI